MNVTVLGLGIMGGSIAKNVVLGGHQLTVWNRTQAKAQALLDTGARWAETPRAAAQGADVVISVVADDEASRAAWRGPDGALGGMQPEAIAIECATISLDWAREWHLAAAARGVRALDAPLGGSKVAAANAQLSLFVGGSPEALATAGPVVEAFSAHQLHLGGATAGVIYKLINNLMAAIQLAGLSEGVALAERAGLNLEAFGTAIANGATASPFVKIKLPQVLSGDFDDVHFALRWMDKDLKYALQLAKELDVPVPTTSAVRDGFRRAMLADLGEKDFSAYVDLVRRAS
jgi:3-hydroxyisobutyrate dehydrogenase